MTDDHGGPLRLYTTSELANLLRVSPDYVRVRCIDGRWPHLEMEYKHGPRYLFTAEQVDEIVKTALVDKSKPPKRATTKATKATTKRATPAPARRRRATS